MWSPTHVQVTVQKAKGLLTKGKQGTNNCFVTIALGKDKYQTSIRDKASPNVEWHEECELAIPDKGNTAELVLTCLHHNNLGIDEFLGQVSLPLRDMDAYDRPRSKWYKLLSKPGQEKKDKDRGELEVRINFTVKAGSLSDLSKKEKHKSSFNQLASSVGGSLLSIGTLEKKKGLKKFANSIGSKLHLTGKKKDKKDGGSGGDAESYTGSMASIGTPNSSLGGSRKWNGKNFLGNTDPGVADDVQSNFDNVSLRSAASNSLYASDQPHSVGSRVVVSPYDNYMTTQTPHNPEIQISDSSFDLPSRALNSASESVAPSVPKRSWNKPRVHLPIIEKSEEEIPSNQVAGVGGSQSQIFGNDYEDEVVVMRAKDEPVMKEKITTEFRKSTPRKFILSGDEPGEDFNLDNLSCNSSTFNSLASETYYDYQPSMDSSRLSCKIDDDLGDDNLLGAGGFNRADSKRRASRKKRLTPIFKEVEAEAAVEPEKSPQAQEDEIVIDFAPKGEANNEMNAPIEISPSIAAKPEPKPRRVLRKEDRKERIVAEECNKAIPHEITKLEHIASLSEKVVVLETRKEEDVATSTKEVEVKEAAAPLTVEIRELKTLEKDILMPHSFLENNLYSHSDKKVSTVQIKLDNQAIEDFTEIIGAAANNKSNFSTSQRVEEQDEAEELVLRKSDASVDFEIRDMKTGNIASNEENPSRLSVSNMRNIFEQKSSPQNSPLVSPRQSFRQSFRMEKQLPSPPATAMREVKTECWSIETSPIEMFERADVHHKATEAFIAQQNETRTETQLAEDCYFANPFESSTVEHIAADSSIAEELVVRQEEYVAQECSIAEAYQTATAEFVVEDSNIVSMSNFAKEVHVASPCHTAYSFQRSNSQLIASETFLPQVLDKCTEQSIAEECSQAEEFERSEPEHIAVHSVIAETLENRKKEHIAVQCSEEAIYPYENVTPKHIHQHWDMPKHLEQSTEEDFAVELASSESKAEIDFVKQLAIQVIECSPTFQIETSASEYYANECEVKQEFEHAEIQNIVTQSHESQIHENIQNVATSIICNVVDASQIADPKNLAIHQNRVQTKDIATQETETNCINATKDLLQATNNQPVPKPRSPVVDCQDDNLSKSSSTILQIIDNDMPSETEPNSNEFHSMSSESEQEQKKEKSDISDKNTKKPPVPRPRSPKLKRLDSAEDSSSSDYSIEHYVFKYDVSSKLGNQDPGVIEDDDEFVFDKLSHKSSGSSLNIRGHNDYNPPRVPSPIMTKDERLAVPPPAKPPRNPADQKLDEWESKLYGNHLEIGSSDSLKRRSWGANNRIPLNTAEGQEAVFEDVKLTAPISPTLTVTPPVASTTSSPSTIESNASPNVTAKFQRRSDTIVEKIAESTAIKDDKIETIYEERPTFRTPTEALAATSPSEPEKKKESKFEKLLNKSPLARTQSREVLDDVEPMPNRFSRNRVKGLPRSDTIAEFNDDIIRNAEDTKEIREKLKKDQKEISEKTEKIEKKHRFGKLKYFSKRMDSKTDSIDDLRLQGERHNPIGHENFNEENSLPELSQELLNKFEGKSREDIILIADSLEKDMITERNRVKELEEYLDNLLLRVMETHPKILQNPYRTASTKSG